MGKSTLMAHEGSCSAGARVIVGSLRLFHGEEAFRPAGNLQQGLGNVHNIVIFLPEKKTRKNKPDKVHRSAKNLLTEPQTTASP